MIISLAPSGRAPAASMLALLLLPAGALARGTGGPVDLQYFRPAMDSAGLFSIESSQVPGHLDPSFGLISSYALGTLSLEGEPAGCAGSQSACPFSSSRLEVTHLVTAHLQASLGLLGILEAGLALPLTLWSGENDPGAAGIDPTDSTQAQGLGDLALRLKARILSTSRYPVGLALAVSLQAPTGDSEGFLGSGRWALAPSLIMQREFLSGQLRLLFSVGVHLRFGEPDAWTDSRDCTLPGQSSSLDCGTGQALVSGNDLTYGVGAAVYLVPGKLEAILEITGKTGLKAPFDAQALGTVHELRAGLRLTLGQSSHLTLGLGRGLHADGPGHAPGSPDMRALLAFLFEPVMGDRDGDRLTDDVDRCPDQPEDFDDFEDTDGCPDPDNDRDGIPDTDDRCPNEPEDRDGIEDKDGCPEVEPLDRDGDGLPDDRDHCPDDPEDRDGFEDKDGCPDPDNDKDGIPDIDDLCPDQAEDKDRFEDKDGCPDPDNDRDRILDAADRCPDEPETYNRFEDKDGCPDRIPALVRSGIIVPLGKIYFETDRAVIRPESYPTLDAVVWALRAHTQITLLQIQGHADERGEAAHNLRLTSQRAEAVRQYLVQKGIDPARLVARGYGESRPLDPRHTEEAWSKNRRVEFLILSRGGGEGAPLP